MLLGPCDIAPPKICCSALLSLESSGRSHQLLDVSIHHDLPQYVGHPRSMKSLLGFVSQFVEMKILPTTSWAATWNKFDRQNKYLVSDSTTSVVGMSFDCEVWALLCHFHTGSDRYNNLKYKWELTQDHSCDCQMEAYKS